MSARNHVSGTFAAQQVVGRFGHVTQHGSSRRRRRHRLGLYLCQTPPFLLGPKAETYLFPVLTEQPVPASSVTRIGRSLCWDWTRTKVRAPELIDLDVNLDTAEGDSFAPEIYNPDNGEPWHVGGALPAGRYETRFCTTIPASVLHDKPVRLRQTLTYDGVLGLWALRVPLPSIIAN